MALTKPQAGGSFFKPADHTNDLILVIEGKRILKDQKHTYQGKESLRDVGVADIAVFRDSSDIENREPSMILKDCQITSQILVSDLERNGWMDGGAGLAVIRRPGQAFVYRDDFSKDAEEAATAWYEAREAERTAALDDMPSFDD